MNQRRHDLGLVPDLDLYRAQAQVDVARGDLARYRQLVAQDLNALNLLLGGSVRSELLPTRLTGVTPPKENFSRHILRGPPAPARRPPGRKPAASGQRRHRRRRAAFFRAFP